jgi:hypothetical protein
MGLKAECEQTKMKGVRTYGEMAQPRSHFVKERLIPVVFLECCFFEPTEVTSLNFCLALAPGFRFISKP